MKELNLYFAKDDAPKAAPFVSALRAAGYDVKENAKDVDEEGLNAIILSEDTTLDALFEAAPWIKGQYEYCSYPHLKLMPVFIYASSKVDPEEAFEGKVGEIYEELMSGEFKPFGFDLDNENPLEEFQRIYEEYAE